MSDAKGEQEQEELKQTMFSVLRHCAYSCIKALAVPSLWNIVLSELIPCSFPSFSSLIQCKSSDRALPKYLTPLSPGVFSIPHHIHFIWWFIMCFCLFVYCLSFIFSHKCKNLSSEGRFFLYTAVFLLAWWGIQQAFVAWVNEWGT